MALTLDASAQVLISNADSTTGWTGPSLAVDPDLKKEGTNSLSSIVRNDGQQLYFSTSGSYANQHLRLWVTTGVYGQMKTKALGGLRFYITSGTGTAYWNIGGIDTYSGGWLNIVVDINSPDTGSVPNTSVSRIGFEFGMTSSFKRVVNTWHDYLRYGDGYIAYGTTWNFTDVAIADTAGGYGITSLYEGIYFLAGEIQIGRNTEATTFSEIGSVLSFSGAPVASTLYNLTLIGHASSTFNFTGDVITTAGQPFILQFDDTGIVDLTFNGNTIQGAGAVYLRASSTACEALANTFDGCGIIYPQGSKFESNIIANTAVTGTNGALYITDTSTAANAKKLNFTTYTGKYAVHIPATVTGAITMDAWLFDGSGTDVYWAGTAGTLTINLTNGANASTSTTAGGTVTFASSTNFTLTGLIDNTEVRIYDSTLATELYGIEDTTGGSTTYAYSGTYADAVLMIHNVAYETIRLVIQLDGTPTSIPIQQRYDRNYKNPV